jgi:hypothetical protein
MEEVAATDDHAHAHAVSRHLGDLAGDPVHHVGVDTHRAAAEHLAGQLQEDPVVGRHVASPRVAPPDRVGGVEPSGLGRIPESRLRMLA